jgi:cysteine desulfurase
VTAARTYLDHNATSPLRPEARRAMIAALELGGNASSIHAEGRAARHAIENARDSLAALIGAPAGSIVFTSGGTEANAMALSPAWLARDSAATRLFVSAVEHASVLRGGRFAPGDVELLPVDADGVVSIEAADAAFRAQKASGGPFLVSVMLANNETGAVQPVAALAELAHEHGGLVHCDAAQAVGKIPVDAATIGADLLTVSAHKLGGPRGAGALAVLRDGLPTAALITGGGQERGYRAGTEDVAAIAGLGVAAAVITGNENEQRKIAALRDELETQIAATSPEAIFFSRQAQRLPNTSCFAVEGMTAETLVIAMDMRGIAVSAGSACSSGKVERSHVLDAMGVSAELGAAAIRVSLGWNTTQADIERITAAWAAIYGTFAARRHAA